jgi:hypothetical protein
MDTLTTRIIKQRCPNKPKIAKRYGSQVAQIPTALGDLRCSACGEDHTTGKSARDILLSIKAAWLAA